jgi:hypothetical protein
VLREIHSQIVEHLLGQNPLGTLEKIFSAFPKGAETTCKANGVELKAGNAGKILKPTDFPFKVLRK